MCRFFAACLASAFLLFSSLALADVSGDTAPSDIALAPPSNPLFVKAQALLDSKETTEKAKVVTARLVEKWRKKGWPIPELKAWDEIWDVPKGSLKVEMVCDKELTPGEGYQLGYYASVEIPESAHGQLVVEMHTIQHNSTGFSAGLARRGQPVRFRQNSNLLAPNSGEYKALYILAVRTVKDGKARVLDAAELSFTVVADE